MKNPHLKVSNSTQQNQNTSVFGEILKPLLSPDFLPIWGILLFAGILKLFSKKNNHAQLADARVATNGEIKSAVKDMIDLVKNPQIDSAALYICEPIGGDRPDAQELETFKGRLTPITEIGRGTLIIGNQGSGKSETILNPLIKSAIDQGFGVILLDIKCPAQLTEIMPYATSKGYESRIFAPGEKITGNCNPLDAIENEDDSTTADQLVFTIRSNLSTSDEKRDKFFDGGAEAMVAGAMLLAKWIGRLSGQLEMVNLLLVDELVNTPDLIDRLLANQDIIPRAAFRSFAQYIRSRGGDDKSNTEASLQATAANLLKPLVSNRFIDCITGTPNFPCFDKERPFWVGEKQLAIFGVSEDYRDVALPLIVTVLEQVGRYNLSNSRKRNKPILIFLDEFAAIKLGVVVNNWLPQKRSVGACIVLAIQYPAQMKEFYGQEGLDKIMGCANVIICNAGSVSNAEALSKELGNREVIIASNSSSNTGGQNASRSTSENEQKQSIPVFDATSLKQLPIGTAIFDTIATKSGSGDSERIGFPYKRRFARLHKQRSHQKKDDVKFYEMFEASIIDNKKGKEENFDVNAKSIECRHLINKYLPLSASSNNEAELERLLKHVAETNEKAEVSGELSEINTSSNNSPESYLLLADLIEISRFYGWELEGDLNDRKVPVPNDWTGDITVDQLIWALESVNIKIVTEV
jgi:type IV secretory pathway TraG/TraD family ATPase VirD4